MAAEGEPSDDWMSASDAMLWEIERDPILRSPITAVLWFDVSPDVEAVEATIDRLISNMPRLTKRVAVAPMRLSTPRWETDQHFDRTFHISRIRLPESRFSRRDVLDHAQRIAARAFDKDRPPWSIEFIDHLDDGTGACVIKLHHSMADGLGLVSVLQHLIDLERHPAPTAPDAHDGAASLAPTSNAASAPSDTDRLAAATSHRIQTEQREAQRALTNSAKTAGEFALRPIETARRLATTGASIVKVIAPAGKSLSPVMAGRSTLIHMDAVTADLAAMRAAAKANRASINDAFVTIVGDALDRYHRRHGPPIESIRMHMPVSIRRPEASGTLDNQFTPTRFVLPLIATDLVARLDRTRTLLHEVRAEPALSHTADIAGAVRRLGGSLSTTLVGSMMRGVDVTTTNVPGPPFPVFLAGSQVTEFFAFGPLAGSAINLTFFSYDGSARIGISSDVAAVADPDAFTADLESAIADFAALA